MSFNFFRFDALLFDIDLDGQRVHSGILRELDDQAIVKNVTKESRGKSETRPFVFADIKAQTSGAQSDLCTQTADPADSPTTLVEAVNSANGPKPILSGPWQDLTSANKKNIRYQAPKPGTIQVRVYRAKDLRTASTLTNKNAKPDALERRSGAEYSERLNALRDIPGPLGPDEHEIKDWNMSHTIEFGPALDVDRVQNVPSINKLYLDPVDQPWASFIFHYRSQEVLKAWDIRLPRGVGVPGYERVMTGKSAFHTEEGVFDTRGRVSDMEESVSDTTESVADTKESLFDPAEGVRDIW